MFANSPADLPADFGHIDGNPDPRDKRLAELEAALVALIDAVDAKDAKAIDSALFVGRGLTF